MELYERQMQQCNGGGPAEAAARRAAEREGRAARGEAEGQPNGDLRAELGCAECLSDGAERVGREGPELPGRPTR